VSLEEEWLKKAYDLKEAGNLLFMKKQFKLAIQKYALVRLYSRAVIQPELPEFQVAKTEKEIEADKKRRQDKGASEDPRDPRNDM
jgi:hypothetical protein